MPRATATSCRRRSATRATSSARASTTSWRQNQSLLLRYMRSRHGADDAESDCAGGPAGAGHAAGLHGLAQLRHRLEPHQSGARLGQPHQRQSRGDERPQPARLRHQLREHQPAGGGPALDCRRRVLRRRGGGAGRRPAAVRQSRQPRVAGRRRRHLDHRAPRAEVRRGRAPRGDEHRVHQPPERRPHVQRHHHRQRGRRFPARAAEPGARHDHPGYPERSRLALCRVPPGRLPRDLAADREPGRALRTADAVHRRQRRHYRVPHRAAVHGLSSRAGRPGLCRRCRRAARHRPDRQEQRRAAPVAGVGSVRRRQDQRALGLRRLLRRPGRPGRLLPERRPVAAVHAAGRAERPGADHPGRSPGRGGRSAQPVPAGADHHRLGRRLQVALRVSLQPRRAAAGRRATWAPRCRTSAHAVTTCRFSWK